MVLPQCESLLRFGRLLLVRDEILGREWPVTIGGQEAYLLLPAARGTPKFGQLDPPPAAHIGWLREQELTGGPWGEACAPSNGLSWLRSAVVRVGFELGDVETHIKAFDLENNSLPNRVALRAFSWLEHLLKWLSALTGQAPQMDRWLTEVPMLAFRWADTDGAVKNIGTAVVGGRELLEGVDQMRAIASDQWQRALTAASSSEMLPIEHEMLTHARGLLHEADTRGAVAAAGSAAELSLARAVSSRLAPSNEPLVSDLLLEGKTLGRLLDLAKRLGLAFPPLQDLVKARNSAVHHAVTFSFDEAEKAISTAAEVLRVHSPIVPHVAAPLATGA
jgi:hypothetical protein